MMNVAGEHGARVTSSQRFSHDVLVLGYDWKSRLKLRSWIFTIVNPVVKVFFLHERGLCYRFQCYGGWSRMIRELCVGRNSHYMKQFHQRSSAFVFNKATRTKKHTIYQGIVRRDSESDLLFSGVKKKMYESYMAVMDVRLRLIISSTAVVILSSGACHLTFSVSDRLLVMWVWSCSSTLLLRKYNLCRIFISDKILVEADINLWSL